MHRPPEAFDQQKACQEVTLATSLSNISKHCSGLAQSFQYSKANLPILSRDPSFPQTVKTPRETLVLEKNDGLKTRSHPLEIC